MTAAFYSSSKRARPTTASSTLRGLVIRADSMLVELFDGSFAGTDERDDEMTVVREALEIRGLKAMAIWVRMVLAARRLLPACR